VAQSLLTPERASSTSPRSSRLRTHPRTARQQEACRCCRWPARANKTWLDFAPVKPKFIGRREFKNVDLATSPTTSTGAVLPDLGPGRPFPAILTDEVVGEAATKVFEEGQAMLKKLIDGRWLTANGVISLLPANTVNDDDIEIYTDDSRSTVDFTYYGLRQQA
jgi:5-methyltetrahydrofolate--homocysteine methyltransferase